MGTSGCGGSDDSGSQFGSQTGAPTTLGAGSSTGAAETGTGGASGGASQDGTTTGSVSESSADGETSTASLTTADEGGTEAVICAVEQFQFTGTEEELQLPPTVRFLHAKAWGAGGNRDDNPCEGGAFGAGGVGGYAEAIFPVAGGETLKVVVGEYGNVGNRKTQGDVGFGGGRGGGLSGVFEGAPALLETEQDRAWLVAGGGGAAGSSSCVDGVPGNHPNAGGQDTMRGEAANGAGGGGGYQGGSASASQGSRGGTGFIAAHAIEQTLAWAELGDATPPNSDDPDYAENAGTEENNGHVVVYVYCSEDDLPEPG